MSEPDDSLPFPMPEGTPPGPASNGSASPGTNGTPLPGKPPVGAASAILGNQELLENTARTLFVTGKADSVTESADLLGLDRARMAEVARAERWHDEREEHSVAVREKAKSTAAEVEAGAISKARRLAASVTLAGVADLAQRMNDKNPSTRLHLKPGEVESVTRIYATLRDAPENTSSEEIARFRKMSIVDQMREINEMVSGQFGAGVLE